MHPVHCAIPPEIFESFIDELGWNSATSECWRTLQACALVSSEFRNRAHHHLFSSMEFVQRPHSTPSEVLSRLWRFRELVQSGMNFPRLTCILYHLRTLTIITDGSIFEAYALLENEDMIGVLRDAQAYSRGIHTLTMQDSSFPIVWPNLTLEFRRALKNLCRSSLNMTTLQLENMVGVPRNLLTGTNIKHVRFHFIEFEQLRMSFGIVWDDLLPKGRLESIDIDYTFPFPPFNLMETNIECNGMLDYCRSFFFGVKKLRYAIHRSDDLQRFIAVASDISSLEILDLELSNSDNGFMRRTPLDLPLDRNPHLRRLIVRHKSLVNIAMRRPLFKVMAILKSVSVPNSLQTIELFFDVSAHPPWTKPVHFFPDPKSWGMLDVALTRKHFGSVRDLIFNLRYCPLQEEPWTFNEGTFRDRCHKILPGVFPLLSSSESKRLALNITFCPGGKEPGAH